MVTLVYGCLAFLAICVGCGVLVACLDALDRLHERRAKRKRSKRVDPMKLDGRPVVDCPGDVWHGLPYAPGVKPDPVEQAFADTGRALGDDAEQHRMTALGERIGVERLCIEIDTEIQRYRRGEDIGSGAPKEQM